MYHEYTPDKQFPPQVPFHAPIPELPAHWNPPTSHQFRGTPDGFPPGSNKEHGHPVQMHYRFLCL